MKKVVLEISSKSWTYVYMMHIFLALPCKILVSQPRIELLPPAVKVQSPNHWTAGEFLMHNFKLS